ncbi:MAG: hypothetical protein HRU41_27250 [Saprospiraceae bacterium]|nr:hypothetical protein [Saprospiraceae bacterium]
MKNFIFLLLLALCCSCQNESKSGEQTAENPSTNIAANNTPSQAASPAAANNPQTPQKLDATLTLAASSPSLAKGQVGCVSVTCVGFVDLVSMQFTMKWDQNVLDFQEVRGFNLPYLGTSNYGAHRSAEGELTFVWIDNSLKGVTKDDGTALYEVCFTGKGNTGQASPFQFANAPTLIEVVHKSVREVNFTGIDGVVKVK